MLRDARNVGKTGRRTQPVGGDRECTCSLYYALEIRSIQWDPRTLHSVLNPNTRGIGISRVVEGRQNWFIGFWRAFSNFLAEVVRSKPCGPAYMGN